MIDRGEDGAEREDGEEREDGVERMECEAFRERLLVADVDELDGTGYGQLARHIRKCDRCRTLADRILAGQLALDGALSELVRRRSPDVIPTATAGRRAEKATIAHRGPWRRALPLAAAAVLAAFLLLPPALRRGGPTAPGDTLRNVAVASADPTREAWRPTLQVEAPAEGRIAVFETSDPEITVVWFY